MLVRPAVGNGGLRWRFPKGQGVASGGSLVQDAEGLAQEFAEGHFLQGQGDSPFHQGAQAEVRDVSERLGGRPAVAAFSMKPHGNFFRRQERRGHRGRMWGNVGYKGTGIWGGVCTAFISYEMTGMSAAPVSFEDFATAKVKEKGGTMLAATLQSLLFRNGITFPDRFQFYEALSRVPGIVVNKETAEVRYEEPVAAAPAAAAATKRHVLIDYSNMSSKPSPPGSEKPVPNVHRIAHRLECGTYHDALASDVLTRFVAGSVSSRGTIEDALSRDKIWLDFAEEDYTIQLTLRDLISVKDRPPKEAEICVDELLHNIMQKILLDSIVRGDGGGSNTLVLATGDGNRNAGAPTNFPDIVERMLRFGWNVEIWAWREATSGEYVRMHSTYPGQVRVIAWDDHAPLFEADAAAAAGGAGGGAAPSRRRTVRKRGNATRKRSTRRR